MSEAVFSPVRIGRLSIGVLGILALALGTLQTVVDPALPLLQRELGVSSGEGALVSNAVLITGAAVAALAGNLIRAGHAAFGYSWRMPPRRSRRRMLRRVNVSGSSIGGGKGRSGSGVGDALVWSVSVVELFELAQGVEKVSLAGLQPARGQAGQPKRPAGQSDGPSREIEVNGQAKGAKSTVLTLDPLRAAAMGFRTTHTETVFLLEQK
ncbi:hypothetical protein SVIO_024480 [Streptomyces violaceusniger]|uniref:Uncharacterized protein n=1 Tax=Streptomyces violaceusniger TaxID=68280 RepID=A0A4D4KSD3_STRVO|nr:hypothetical protein SVIO_024480 [Streptomyces violaceusniger]